jgi:succinate dehydrogenase / fumarate reductase iron-sulfur subunit
MFDHLKQVKAWIELDGSYDLGPGPQLSNEIAQERYCLLTLHDVRLLSRGVSSVFGDDYIGPQAIAQARLFNMHPTAASMSMIA